ncbi:hypothetical protein GCM10008018_71750 [Paenibacillus marchantiophytorum]|uniref:Uncharacterized protein n=1 Tax=Paenibacillus marchantiophytorum TaxID=1619310 RepID=A0ABQ1FIL8_9BACL|nr:hypothetical protein GCM10008018_71750 [Paenibacillus marchantiophytorum]
MRRGCPIIHRNDWGHPLIFCKQKETVLWLNGRRTKTEAIANRYTFVWGKAVVKHKAKLKEKFRKHMAAGICAN